MAFFGSGTPGVAVVPLGTAFTAEFAFTGFAGPPLDGDCIGLVEIPGEFASRFCILTLLAWLVFDVFDVLEFASRDSPQEINKKDRIATKQK